LKNANEWGTRWVDRTSVYGIDGAMAEY